MLPFALLFFLNFLSFKAISFCIQATLLFLLCFRRLHNIEDSGTVKNDQEKKRYTNP
jgi:hypothetical protein